MLPGSAYSGSLQDDDYSMDENQAKDSSQQRQKIDQNFIFLPQIHIKYENNINSNPSPPNRLGSKRPRLIEPRQSEQLEPQKLDASREGSKERGSLMVPVKTPIVKVPSKQALDRAIALISIEEKPAAEARHPSALSNRPVPIPKTKPKA